MGPAPLYPAKYIVRGVFWVSWRHVVLYFICSCITGYLSATICYNAVNTVFVTIKFKWGLRFRPSHGCESRPQCTHRFTKCFQFRSSSRMEKRNLHQHQWFQVTSTSLILMTPLTDWGFGWLTPINKLMHTDHFHPYQSYRYSIRANWVFKYYFKIYRFTQQITNHALECCKCYDR